jgi:hypothetical protein
MTDETQNTSAPPAKEPARHTVVVSEYLWGKVWGVLKSAFSPVQSLWTARTAWLAVAVIALGLVIGWRDVRYFALVSAWTVVGIVVAFHGRRFLVPDVKLSELYQLAKEGNDAAARLACGVLYTQIAIMVILAVALLYRPASVS